MNYDYTEEDFRKWLKHCREALADHTPDEVANLACAVGFDREMVTRVLSHFNDAMQGSSFDNKATFYVWHETNTIERLSGKLDFSNHWREVHQYQSKGVPFND